MTFYHGLTPPFGEYVFPTTEQVNLSQVDVLGKPIFSLIEIDYKSGHESPPPIFMIYLGTQQAPKLSLLILFFSEAPLRTTILHELMLNSSSGLMTG